MKIIKTTVEQATKFVEFVKTQYIDTNGIKRVWDWIRRVGNTKGVVIVAEYNGKLVITKEFRVPLKDHEWGFPAGLIDPNYTIEDTIKKELKEETGLDVTQIHYVSPATYNTAGITDESIYTAYVECTGTPSDKFTEASEDITTYLMDQEQVKHLVKMAESNIIKFGAKAFIICRQFVKYGTIL